MPAGRLVVGWALVTVWLVVWAEVARRRAGAAPLDRRALVTVAGEALLLTLFGALWFGSLGAGAWWLVFGLVGALMMWPVRSPAAALGVLRIVAAGGLLALRLGP